MTVVLTCNFELAYSCFEEPNAGNDKQYILQV